jgi:hypothetical protein
MHFSGIAHPPPGQVGYNHVANVQTHAEMDAVALGDAHDDVGTPLHVEHDVSRTVGRVHSSWRERDGALRVVGCVSDAAVASRVRAGELPGLSLGTSVALTRAGRVHSKEHQELSLCEAPRRPRCYITHVDHRPAQWRVRHRAARSSDADAHGCARRNKGSARRTLGGATMEAANGDALSPADAEELARLREFRQNVLLECRKDLEQLAPDVKTFIAAVSQDPSAAAYGRHFDDVSKWADALGTAEEVTGTTSLARVLHCASARDARVTEQLNAQKEREELLQQSQKRCLELEETVKALQNKEPKRVDELTDQQFLFSKHVDARENALPPGKAVAKPSPQLGSLLDFVAAEGRGSARIMPSSSAHPIVGGGGAGEPSSYGAFGAAVAAASVR